MSRPSEAPTADDLWLFGEGRHERLDHGRHDSSRHEPVYVSAHSPRPPLRPAAARVQHTVTRAAGPQVRDQIVFPASPSDADWDVPAYQRRNGG